MRVFVVATVVGMASIAGVAGVATSAPPDLDGSVVPPRATTFGSTTPDVLGLDAIYADSMRQLRGCIDDRRSTPDVWSETAGQSFPC